MKGEIPDRRDKRHCARYRRMHKRICQVSVIKRDISRSENEGVKVKM